MAQERHDALGLRRAARDAASCTPRIRDARGRIRRTAEHKRVDAEPIPARPALLRINRWYVPGRSTPDIEGVVRVSWKKAEL